MPMGKMKDKAELLADRLELPSDALAGTAKLTVNGRSDSIFNCFRRSSISVSIRFTTSLFGE